MEYLLSDLSKEATCFLLQTNKCPSSDINHPSFSLPPAPILSLEPRYSHSLGILSWNEFCCCWMSFRDPIWNGETVTILGKAEGWNSSFFESTGSIESTPAPDNGVSSLIVPTMLLALLTCPWSCSQEKQTLVLVPSPPTALEVVVYF